jgi:hypothetical protein
VSFDELMADHTPDELAEFARVMNDPRFARGPRIAFAYDMADALEDGSEVLHIHARNPKTGAFGSALDINKLKLNHEIAVTKGVLKDESATLLKEFFRTKRDGSKK